VFGFLNATRRNALWLSNITDNKAPDIALNIAAGIADGVLGDGIHRSTCSGSACLYRVAQNSDFCVDRNHIGRYFANSSD
jgi:hypothetical protein